MSDPLQLALRHPRRTVALTGGLLMLALGIWLLSARFTEQIDSYAACVRAGYPVLETYPPVCRARGHNFVGPRTEPTPTPEPGVAQQFQLLVEGDSGGDYPKRQEVITSQTEWSRYWAAIHASVHPLPPILPVDFATSNVVAISEGRKPTTGYNLKVTSVITTSTSTTVHVTEQIPTVTCVVAQRLTNRYYIIRTPKLPQPVSFRIDTEKRRCQ